MMNSYRRFWDNITNFSGVSNRPDYWWAIIINYVLGIILMALVQKLLGHPINSIYNWGDWSVNIVSNLIALIVWLGTLSLKVRRLHDTDRSGWWILIDLIPLIGTIWFFILMVLPSKNGRWN